MKLQRAVIVIGVIGIGLIAYSKLPSLGIEREEFQENIDSPALPNLVAQESNTFPQAFKRSGLLTNTSKHSIELENVLSGGPGKDGIPAINTPEFISVKDSQEARFVNDEALGIVVEYNEVHRFYPYSILNWHEIVNDTIDDLPISVTFCPLCGSAIVFDRRLADGTVVNFGVSGKLFESNLLMYDSKTETLWSQARGEAVVGDLIGEKLKHIDSDRMSFSEFTKHYPNGEILSDKTGFNRDYTHAPYGNYDSNDQLYFPVSNIDSRLPKKEILYVVRDEDESVGFVKKNLVEKKKATISVGKEQYTAIFADGSVSVTTLDGSVLPGYHEMRFSWVVHNKGSKNIWLGE